MVMERYDSAMVDFNSAIANDKSNFNALIKRDGISDTLAERIVNYEIAKVDEALQLKESLKKKSMNL